MGCHPMSPPLADKNIPPALRSLRIVLQLSSCTEFTSDKKVTPTWPGLGELRGI